VCSSLRYRHLKGRTFTLKLRYSDFQTITRATTIEPTDDDSIVFKTMKELLEASYTRHLPLRLLGVRASHLVEEEQLELKLFPEDMKRTSMLNAVDKIRKKFGDDVIHVGRQ
jgi:DNA polymerase-4